MGLSYRGSTFGSRSGSGQAAYRVRDALSAGAKHLGSVRGGGRPQVFGDLKKALRAMPLSVAAETAGRAAPAISRLAQSAFDSGQTVYGDARPTGVDGGKLSLQKSGKSRASTYFKSAGTVVRCVLGTPYYKYLIGKYRILPMGALPASWSRKLTEVVGQVIS